MRDLIISLFGTYTPVTYNTQVFAPDGTSYLESHIPDGLAGVDWPFICGVALFGITLYCVLRIIGSLIKNA